MNFDPNALFYAMQIYFQKKFLDIPKFKRERLYFLNEGSSRCFHSEQKIVTKNGSKCIADLGSDDLVLSYNHTTNEKEYKKVLSVIPSESIKPCLKITLKDGTEIKCTEDHEIYHKGRYIKAKDLVSLWYEKINNDKR